MSKIGERHGPLDGLITFFFSISFTWALIHSTAIDGIGYCRCWIGWWSPVAILCSIRCVHPMPLFHWNVEKWDINRLLSSLTCFKVRVASILIPSTSLIILLRVASSPRSAILLVVILSGIIHSEIVPIARPFSSTTSTELEFRTLQAKRPVLWLWILFPIKQPSILYPSGSNKIRAPIANAVSAQLISTSCCELAFIMVSLLAMQTPLGSWDTTFCNCFLLLPLVLSASWVRLELS